MELPTYSEAEVGKELKTLKESFEKLEAEALTDCKSILGESFEPTDVAARQELVNNVGPALGLLEYKSLGGLPSAARLARLGKLTDGELSQAEATTEKIVNEAKEVAALAKEPDRAARERLYVRVANWVRQHGSERTIDFCPVCKSSLDGKIDLVTGGGVKEHIEGCLKGTSDYLEKTVTEWENSAVRLLANELAETLSLERNTDLPSKPTALISGALVDELFGYPQFQGSLAPLKMATEVLCNEKLMALPEFSEPDIKELPACFGDRESGIKKAIGRVVRAVAFARWRKENKEGCKEALDGIIGKVDLTKPDSEHEGTPIEKWTLSERLAALERMVRNATPLRVALEKVKVMLKKVEDRAKKEDLIAAYGRAASEVGELLGLRELVEAQVGVLIKELSSATENWKDALYRPAFTGAPKVYRTDVRSDGSLAVEAEMLGTATGAEHISNASDLRATLLAFVMAFREYLLGERGGLPLLLLDDLQELFDPDNRLHIARNVAKMVECGGQVIVTTNDHRFGRVAVGSAREKLGADSVHHHCIHALRAIREHIELGIFTDEIDLKRKEFERPENENEHQPARDYLNQARIYIENRLIDLFDVSDSGLGHKPTLGDLMNAVRGERTAGIEPFTGGAFQALVNDSALTDGSKFLALMNRCHHGDADQITYRDVWEVRGECIHVVKLVKAVYKEYEHWLKRDVREDVPSIPDMPGAATIPMVKLQIFENLAASTSEVGSGEPIESGDWFDGNILRNHAIYVVNTHNFGFAAEIRCRVIVDLSGEPVPDGSLVIALYKDKVFARRLLRDAANPELVALGSEAENPLERPPSCFLPTEEVSLLRVVGVLFDDRVHYAKPSEAVQEAVLTNDWGGMVKAEVLLSARGPSALPWALPEQRIIGGRSLTASELAAMEGRAVAIETREGGMFKRVGAAVPGAPHIRLFESVGGRGDSVLVQMEEVEEPLTTSGLPQFMLAREVLGVLY